MPQSQTPESSDTSIMSSLFGLSPRACAATGAGLLLLTVTLLSLLAGAGGGFGPLFVSSIVALGLLALGATMLVTRLRQQLVDARLQLDSEAIVDPLTGLSSARALELSLHYEFHRCIRVGQRLSIALLDIDGFDQLCDEHGAAAGDTVLREAAKRFRETARESDVLCRKSAGRFALLMPGTDIDQAYRACERLRHALSAPLEADDTLFEMRLSAGIAEATPEDSPEGLFERASDTLEEAIAGGRDRISLALDSQAALAGA